MRRLMPLACQIWPIKLEPAGIVKFYHKSDCHSLKFVFGRISFPLNCSNTLGDDLSFLWCPQPVKTATTSTPCSSPMIAPSRNSFVSASSCLTKLGRRWEPQVKTSTRYTACMILVEAGRWVGWYELNKLHCLISVLLFVLISTRFWV